MPVSFLAESKALQQRLSRVADPTVTVTVGVMPGLLATAAATAFEAGNPSRRAVVVQVGWADQVDVVHRGEVDVVYAREPIDHHGLGTAPLLEEPRVVVLPAADPLAKKRSVRLADLASKRLLQDPATVPEWYAIATPEHRRAGQTGAHRGGEAGTRCCTSGFRDPAALDDGVLPQAGCSGAADPGHRPEPRSR